MKTRTSLAWLACLALLCWLSDLKAEEIAVVKEGRVNVRGQPSLVGEVITQLQKGEKVVVLEQVNVAKPKTNEPPRWAKIQMPTNTPVWLNASYIDPASKTVKVNRLNLRAGPGENYSVVGRLQHGTPITEIRRVEDWMEIETPPGAYGFVAADLLTKPQEVPSGSLAKNEPTGTAPPPLTPAPQPAKVEPAPVPPPATTTTTPPESVPQTTVATPPAEPAPLPKSEPVTPPTAQIPAVQPSPEPVAPPVTVPPPVPTPTPKVVTPSSKAPAEELIKRVVRREGLVRSTASIQAPTYYELLNPDNRKTINYLHADNLQVNLKDYRGRRIIVTGEEAIDPRWPKTPVIEVESLELIP